MPASWATTGAKVSIASPGTTMLLKPHLSRRFSSRSHSSSTVPIRTMEARARPRPETEHGRGARGRAAAGDDYGGEGHDLELDRTEAVTGAASRTHAKQRSK